MRIIPYFFSIVIFIAINLKPNQAVAFFLIERENIVRSRAVDVQCSIQRPTALWGIAPWAADTDTNDAPSDSIDEITKQGADSEGAMSSILGGLTLCYSVLANLLLYPIFSFLLLILTVGAIVISFLWFKKIRSERSISATWIIFTCLYFLFYLDLFLVVFQQRKVLFLCLELEKDLFLMSVSTSFGYVVGRFFSSKLIEEKELP